jgi:cytosine/adenosine deaminase-related metal-dependent hydrolase
MIRYHASWVVPITAPPIRNGWVEVDAHRVTGLGGARDRAAAAATQQVDLTGTAILPSLVNTHTHLELSGLRTLVPPAASLPMWVRQVFSRTAEVGLDEGEVVRAIGELHAAGIGLVGDITNTLMSVAPLVRSPVAAVVFKELLGFNEPEPLALVERERAAMTEGRYYSAGEIDETHVRLQLGAHAPYSVSPGLFLAIRDAVGDGPLCVHLAESSEEIAFLRSGTGPWRAVLEARGRWDPGWEPFDAGPVAYLEKLGWITSRSVVVHGVHLTDAELGRLAAVGATVVTCPRSNRWTGAGTPPIARFYASGVRVAVGTDSLASAPDLSVFAELAEIRRLAPTQPASTLLRSATSSGAEALGWSRRGAIAEGMEASLIAVRCAPTIDDVEEYLVNDITSEDVRWLDES